MAIPIRPNPAGNLLFIRAWNAIKQAHELWARTRQIVQEFHSLRSDGQQLLQQIKDSCSGLQQIRAFPDLVNLTKPV